jgi:hypothetical protein
MRNTKKTIIITAIFILIISGFLSLLMNEVIKFYKKDKAVERYRHLIELVDTRCEELDSITLDEWACNKSLYAHSFLKYFEFLDTKLNIFSAVYASDFEIASYRKPQFTGQPFDPTMFPDVLTAFDCQITGDMVIPFSVDVDGRQVIYPMNLYFRRAPCNAEDPYIVAIAMSVAGEEEELSKALNQLIFIAFGITALSASFLIVTFTRYLHPRYVKYIPDDVEEL